MAKYKALHLGTLPVKQINKTLGTYLDPGEVWVSRVAHRHIAEDHSDDHPNIIDALADILEDPHYIGISPKNRDNFYIVSRNPRLEPKAGLVAIGFEMTEYGTYSVKSAYRIKHSDVDARRQKGFLHITKR